MNGKTDIEVRPIAKDLAAGAFQYEFTAVTSYGQEYLTDEAGKSGMAETMHKYTVSSFAEAMAIIKRAGAEGIDVEVAVGAFSLRAGM